MGYRRHAVLVVLAACGRLHFDASDDLCRDPADPNDAAPGATIMEATSCDTLAHSLSALATPAVADWYTAPYVDNTVCDITPLAKVTAGVEATLCVFFACENGARAAVTCAANDTAADHDGAAGCCGTRVDPQVRLAQPNCNAPGPIVQGENGGALLMSVVITTGDACTAYTLAWGDS